MHTADPLTVIVADDHPLIREGIDTMLKDAPGITILAIVSNGHELVNAVRSYLPQVVLTDIRMPVLDGVEAARLIRARHPDIKIVALTSYDEQWLVDDMMNIGASGYVVKDANEAELTAAIKTGIGLHVF